ncbi:hypothetical protein OK351_01055 [Glutamicibacter sp. MNS18]|uniref:hypothetical protein n=1 Tax=Glutamicibacter sp. MNS18 TaxID=2989817 RepID=UPI0022355717|nr:hypothetical protein [Glutamicibacter sp. MNS18]MCW4464105.1 hypothetical protein [Glutamicibacter sp. MNS18]
MKNTPRRTSDHHLRTPGELRIARLCWVLASVLFLGFAANLFISVARAAEPSSGPWFLGSLLAAAGLLILWLSLRLWRSDLMARTQLTWLGLITALPLFLRFGRYSILAGMVLVAVALMWTPASIKYFRTLYPRKTRRK